MPARRGCACVVLGRVAAVGRRGRCLGVFFWEYGPQRAWSLAIYILLMFPRHECALRKTSIHTRMSAAYLAPILDDWIVRKPCVLQCVMYMRDTCVVSEQDLCAPGGWGSCRTYRVAGIHCIQAPRFWIRPTSRPDTRNAVQNA